ncbi:hypothetical protein Pan161_51570 [Gimesia algae]|uniref:Uncharacterized protein n=1 Tax=Gimesia algae TaxID=2527971 RepID=A0A517VKH2_9PLAN|nr:hypothetical protein Pan161_51570 [Gimesia algae]
MKSIMIYELSEMAGRYFTDQFILKAVWTADNKDPDQN